MWSQCVCVFSKVSEMGLAPNSSRRALPSWLIPEPASITMISPPILNSYHEVLPPYRMVSGPGVGIEPRTPQNLKKDGEGFGELGFMRLTGLGGHLLFKHSVRFIQSL